MANPPKKKGTGGETELKDLLHDARGHASFRVWTRTAPTLPYDLHGTGFPGLTQPPIEALATRPDRGRWLVTIALDDFIDFLHSSDREVHVEVKRYARFALHTIFEKKFGRR